MATTTLKDLIALFDSGTYVDNPNDSQDAAALVNQWRSSPDWVNNSPVNESKWGSVFTTPEKKPQAPTPPPIATYTSTNPGATSTTPVSSTGLDFAAGLTPASLSDPGSSPVANGFPLLRESFEMMLAADEARRASIDQEIRFQTMFAQLLGDDPAVAADLAVRLGMPGLEPDLQYLNRFATGAQSTFGGKVGSQEVTLPFSFNRGQLRFLDANPNVARAVQSVSERFRRPDVLQTSMASLLPTSGVASAFGFSG